jgi:hypothetical protein
VAKKRVILATFQKPISLERIGRMKISRLRSPGGPKSRNRSAILRVRRETRKDHDSDLLDDFRVSKRSDITNVHTVGDSGQHPAHDFARACLGHIRNDANLLGSRNLTDRRLEDANDLSSFGLRQ